MSTTTTTLKSITSQLDKIKNTVNNFQGAGKNKKPVELEEPAIKDALNQILSAVSGLASLLSSGDQLCPNIKILEDKNRKLKDELDHQAQKSLKGKFMLTSLPASVMHPPSWLVLLQQFSACIHDFATWGSSHIPHWPVFFHIDRCFSTLTGVSPQ